MSKLNLKSNTVKTTTVTGVIWRKDLHTLLGLPDNVSLRAWIKVPGGGDWSNEDLELNDYPIEIQYQITETLDKSKSD